MDALQQKEHELELVMRLDQVRDTLNDDGDPQNMFDALVTLLHEWFRCSAAAIMLVAETSDDVELISVNGYADSCRNRAMPDCNTAKWQ